MSLQVKGTIKKVYPKFEKGNFKATPIEFETEGQYPQTIILDFVGDRADEAEKFQAGKVINAYFNLRGNEHNGRVYNKLQVWKWESI